MTAEESGGEAVAMLEYERAIEGVRDRMYEMAVAAQAGRADRVADAERRWFRNAREIAAFFAQINPFWSEERWREMLFDHLRLVETEAVQMLQGNYQGSIATYDAVEEQSLEMADEMWRGIVRQFPRRF